MSIIPSWQYRDRNALGVVTSGIQEHRSCQNAVQVAGLHTGTNLTSGSPKRINSRSGDCAPDRRIGATMSTPSKPDPIIPQGCPALLNNFDPYFNVCVCLKCPLFMCLHEQPSGKRSAIKCARAEQIHELFYSHRVKRTEIASMLQVSYRTVCRSLKAVNYG